MKERKKKENFSNDLIFDAIQPFIWIIAPKLLIDELIGQKRLDVLMSILIGLLSVLRVLNQSVLRCSTTL